jgi:hypothetical protein
MKDFHEWLESINAPAMQTPSMDDQRKLYAALNDIRQGTANTLANYVPDRGYVNDLSQYLIKLQDAMRNPIARDYARELQQAYEEMRLGADRLAQAKQQAGFRGGPEWARLRDQAAEPLMQGVRRLVDVMKRMYPQSAA